MAAFSSAGQVRRRPVPVNTSRRRARAGIGVSSEIDMYRSPKPAPIFTPHAWFRKALPRRRLRTDLEGHNASLDSLVRCLEAERGERPHLGEFLDRGRATNRLAPMFLPAYPVAANVEPMLAAE